MTHGAATTENNVSLCYTPLSRPIQRQAWRELMYRAKFCLVPDGFSSVSARLYETILHGCVPVIITDAFHGALERSIPWGQIGVFVKRREIPRIPAILRERVGEERWQRMHWTITQVHSMLHTESGDFWAALMREL